jgi:hypothetical protein
MMFFWVKSPCGPVVQSTDQPTRCLNPKEHHHNRHRRENIKSHKYGVCVRVCVGGGSSTLTVLARLTLCGTSCSARQQTDRIKRFVSQPSVVSQLVEAYVRDERFAVLHCMHLTVTIRQEFLFFVFQSFSRANTVNVDTLPLVCVDTVP